MFVRSYRNFKTFVFVVTLIKSLVNEWDGKQLNMRSLETVVILRQNEKGHGTFLGNFNSYTEIQVRSPF